jgi:hypothetical protein
VRYSTVHVDSNWKPMAVRDCDDLRSLATFCLADLGTPFLAGAKLPSIKGFFNVQSTADFEI